jgi:exopolysaccharide biosynthesis polyprenyl glycosylphosphotransferase
MDRVGEREQRKSRSELRSAERLALLPAEDVRATRPYLLAASPLRALSRRALSISTLVALDLGGLALGLYIALGVREFAVGNTPVLWGVLWQAETDWLPFLMLLTFLVFWQAGLYARRELRAGVGRIVSSLGVVALLTLAFGLGTRHHFDTFGIFPMALVTGTVCIGLLRASYESMTRTVMRAAGVRRRVILVGDAAHLAPLHRLLGAHRGGIEYDFVGAVAPSREGVPLRVLGRIGALSGILAEHSDVHELIVAESDLSERELQDVVEIAHRRGVVVRIAPRTTEVLREKGEYVPGQATPLFEVRPPAFAGSDWAVKRTFEVVVSALVVLVGLPVWLLIAAAIKAGSRGPVLYRDRRIGLGEREFEMFKFRTMVYGAAAMQQALEAMNEADGALFKIKDDPRVTRVGRVLRRFSLDELPQLLNVLRSEMSLVGPRPLPIRDYLQLEDWHRKRYHVLPGMTGLWQISGRSTLSFDDLVRLDFYYLDNWSIWIDISILARTLPAVVARRGAY